MINLLVVLQQPLGKSSRIYSTYAYTVLPKFSKCSIVRTLGKVIKRFKVVIHCSWQGDTGTLDEDFTYSDGTTQKRIWTLTETAPGVFTGTADDVVGSATGLMAGNALNWKYTLALPVDGKVYNVQFDDWMYLMDDKVMINRAQMSKFGIYLGEVTLAFYKR